MPTCFVIFRDLTCPLPARTQRAGAVSHRPIDDTGDVVAAVRVDRYGDADARHGRRISSDRRAVAITRDASTVYHDVVPLEDLKSQKSRRAACVRSLVHWFVQVQRRGERDEARERSAISA